MKTLNIKRFPDKRVAITGGASGLGKAMAVYFAKQGWRVAIADINDTRGECCSKELQAYGADAFYQRCDVQNIDDIAAFKKTIVDRWGGLDIIVNNAGVATHGPIDTASLDDWDWVININLMGVVRGCKLFVELFKQQGYGHVVNIASMAGLIHAPEMNSYNATKAAVVALSETMRVELKPYGIGISVVCPSFFETNLAESARSPDENIQALINKLLAKSNITADDIARDVYDAVKQNTFYVLPHKNDRNYWYLKRHVPAAYFALMDQLGKRIKKTREKNGRLNTA